MTHDQDARTAGGCRWGQYSGSHHRTGGTGTKFDSASTVPLPAGTFVTHFAKQVHYHGAKDEEAVVLTVGEGPATPTPAEEQ
jgi:hypothetical protein